MMVYFLMITFFLGAAHAQTMKMSALADMVEMHGNSPLIVSFSDGDTITMKPPIHLKANGDNRYILNFYHSNTGVKETRIMTETLGVAYWHDRKTNSFGITNIQKVNDGNAPGKCQTVGTPEVLQYEFFSGCNTVKKKLCSMSVTCKNDPRFGNIDMAQAICSITEDEKCPDLYTCANDRSYSEGIPIGESNMELFKSHPLKDSRYLQQCLDKLPQGASKKVSDKINFPCNIEKNITGGGTRKYTLKKINGRMVISTSIYLNYLGAQGQKSNRFDIARNAKKCMQDFFARHNLVLDITFKGDKDSHHKHNCDHTVNLHDNMNREDAKNWASISRKGKKMSQEQICGTYIHELLHNFGLPDAYPDPLCPDRPVIHKRDSVMACLECTKSRIYDEHLKMLLWPMCSEVI